MTMVRVSCCRASAGWRPEVPIGVALDMHTNLYDAMGADAAQQLTFAVVVGLGDHRAVQVEQHRVAALGYRGADAVGDGLEGGVIDRPAGAGRRGDGHGVLGAGGFGQVDEGGDGRAGATVGRHRGSAFGRHGGAGGKPRQRRGHR